MTAQPQYFDRDAAGKYAEILKAIGHPVRLQIIDILTCGERCVGELENLTDCQQAIVSQQLKILRMAGLVRAERRDGKAYYHLEEVHLKDLMRCLRNCNR